MQDYWIAHLWRYATSRAAISSNSLRLCNRTLWPICHYRLDLANLSESNAAAYFRVNEHFRRQVHKLLRPDDISGCMIIISFPWRVSYARWAAPTGLVFPAHSMAGAGCASALPF